MDIGRRGWSDGRNSSGRLSRSPTSTPWFDASLSRCELLLSRRNCLNSREWLRDLQAHPRRWVAQSLILLAIAGLGIFAVTEGSAFRPVTVAPSKVVPHTSDPAPSPSVSLSRARDGIEAKLVFSAPCWVEAVADGRTVLKTTLSRGSLVIRARHTLVLTLANAGGVRLLIGSRSVPTGSPGQVVNLTFEFREGRVIRASERR
jgi:hypothetical protein